MDDLAHASGQDPLAFRLRALRANPRARVVLELAAERAGWGNSFGPGRFLGCALSTEDHGNGYAVYIAQVAGVSRILPACRECTVSCVRRTLDT